MKKLIRKIKSYFIKESESEEVFHHVTGFFEEPTAEEGLNIKLIKRL